MQKYFEFKKPDSIDEEDEVEQEVAEEGGEDEGLLPQESVRGPATSVKRTPGALCSIPLYACSSLTYF